MRRADATLVTSLLALILAACSSDDETRDVEPSDAADDPVVAEEEDPEEEPEEIPREVLERFISVGELERFTEGRGLVVNEEAATPGLTLVMPLNSRDIHLVDLEGEVQHTWATEHAPGGWAYLADDGSLYRSARKDEDPHFKGGGIGGIIERLAPDGAVLWRYELADEERHQHHDIEVLPNGNVLMIVWERQSAEDAVARGRDPRGVGEAGLWSDAVYEVRPTPPVGGEIVWSWHSWDHLVQDVDPSKPDHGVLSDHAGRIDVNANFVPPSEVSAEERVEEEERRDAMAALGYGGGDDEDEEEEPEEDGPPPRDWDETGDWLHTNAVNYHEALDLIVLSSPELCEIFVIDHSTTREEAAGSTGGRWGHGGDLLWRWGNPLRYGLGTEADQELFYQHDPQWLRTPEGLKLTVFNNGGERQDGSGYSEVMELTLPFAIDGGFVRGEGEAFGPTAADWSYADPETFFSGFISGASRLGSGNTLVCSGAVGRIFEVTADGEVVWDYYSPLGGDVEPPDHAGKAPPFSLYRVARYGEEEPGVMALR